MDKYYQKKQAKYGDQNSHRQQGRAIRINGIRVSESEHIQPRAHIILQTKNSHGISPYDNKAYGQSTTIVIPRDMAKIKTNWDNRITQQAQKVIKAGKELPESLKKSLSQEAAYNRTIRARDIAITRREQRGQSTQDLKAISNEMIKNASHLQRKTGYPLKFQKHVDKATPSRFVHPDLKEQILSPKYPVAQKQPPDPKSRSVTQPKINPQDLAAQKQPSSSKGINYTSSTSNNKSISIPPSKIFPNRSWH